MSIVAILSLLGAVYAIINVVLPMVQMDPLLRTYALQPVLWGIVIVTVRLLPSYHPLGKVGTRHTYIQLALGIAFVEILLYMIGGLFYGFGKNPSSNTALGITENIFFVGSMLIAMEISRAHLVAPLGRRHSFLAITLVTLVFTFISLPLSQLTGFKLQIESSNLVISSWMPLLAENLLASLLVLRAGARASLSYRVLLAAFWWLCPILPDLTWALKGLIGVAVPVLGMVVVSSYYSSQARRGKARRHAQSSPFPASWTVTTLACVALLWFFVGVFPLRPSLIGSGSMTPALQTGDIVIVAEAPANTIGPGDIIEYRKDKNTNIVHRVISINDISGTKTFTTKGDANESEDIEPVLPDNIIGKVVFNVRRVGFIAIFVKRLFAGGG